MLFCFKVHEAVIPSDLVQGRKVGGILYMYYRLSHVYNSTYYIAYYALRNVRLISHQCAMDQQTNCS